MVGHPCLHCRRHSQRLMDTAEVVVHEIKRDVVREVIDFFREGIRQAREPPHMHPHAQVLAFNVAGGNVFLVWISCDDLLLAAGALRRTVSCLLLCRSVNFNQLRVVDVRAEGIFHFVTVSFAAPVMRTVVRIELPSISDLRTWTCFSRLSLFM